MVKLGNANARARIKVAQLMEAARVAREARKHRLAIARLDEVIALCSLSPDLYEAQKYRFLCEAFHMTGVSYEQRRVYDKAALAYSTALSYALDDMSGVESEIAAGKALADRGNLYSKLGKRHEADDDFQRADLLLRQQLDKTAWAVLCGLMGRHQSRQGNFDVALLYHVFIDNELAESGNKHIFMYNLLPLARAMARCGMKRHARAYAKEAAALADQVDDAWLRLAALAFLVFGVRGYELLARTRGKIL